MEAGDYGWFVTLSDYKPKAKQFLEKNPQISAINGAQLAKRVYIPVVEEE